MLGQLGRESLRRLPGEISGQSGRESGIVGQGAVQYLRVQVELGIGHQHRQFGPGEALLVIFQFLDLGVAGEEFHRAIQLAPGFQGADKARAGIDIAGGGGFRHRQRQGLVVIVGQHQGGDIVGHAGQQAHRASGNRSRARRYGPAEQDFQIHFMVGGVHAGGIVHRVGIDASAARGHIRCGRAG